MARTQRQKETGTLPWLFSDAIHQIASKPKPTRPIITHPVRSHIPLSSLPTVSKKKAGEQNEREREREGEESEKRVEVRVVLRFCRRAKGGLWATHIAHPQTSRLLSGATHQHSQKALGFGGLRCCWRCCCCRCVLLSGATHQIRPLSCPHKNFVWVRTSVTKIAHPSSRSR